MHQTVIYFLQIQKLYQHLKSVRDSIGIKVNQFEIIQYFLNSFDDGTLLKQQQPCRRQIKQTGRDVKQRLEYSKQSEHQSLLDSQTVAFITNCFKGTLDKYWKMKNQQLNLLRIFSSAVYMVLFIKLDPQALELRVCVLLQKLKSDKFVFRHAPPTFTWK